MRKLFDRVCFSPDEPTGGSLEGLEEEIADFIDDSVTVGDGEAGDGEEGPSGETPPEETPKTEVKIEGEVIPKEEPKVESVPTDELSLLRKQVETLQGLVNELATPKQPTVEGMPKVEGETPPTVQAMLESIDFDDVMKDKESFVKFFLEAANVIKAEAVQQTLIGMPEVVGSVVQRQTSLRDVAREFYKTYPELKPVKQYVGRVANEISAENPDLTIQQVLDKAAEKVRQTLNVEALIKASEKRDAGKPALGGGTGGAKSKSGPSTGLQSEIDEFISD